MKKYEPPSALAPGSLPAATLQLVTATAVRQKPAAAATPPT